MRPLTPRGPWLRGLDLNRRPLGYEGNFGEDSALLSTAKYPSSMTIAHSGASRSSDLVAQPSPLGLPPHGIEHLGIDPNGDQSPGLSAQGGPSHASHRSALRGGHRWDVGEVNPATPPHRPPALCGSPGARW